MKIPQRGGKMRNSLRYLEDSECFKGEVTRNEKFFGLLKTRGKASRAMNIRKQFSGCNLGSYTEEDEPSLNSNVVEHWTHPTRPNAMLLANLDICLCRVTNNKQHSTSSSCFVWLFITVFSLSTTSCHGTVVCVCNMLLHIILIIQLQQLHVSDLRVSAQNNKSLIIIIRNRSHKQTQFSRRHNQLKNRTFRETIIIRDMNTMTTKTAIRRLEF